MFAWILLGLILVAVVIFIKLSHFRHRFFAVIIVILALFLFVSVTYVASKNSLDFSTYDGLMRSLKIYGGWLVNLFSNFRGLTGSAIKMDWTSNDAGFLNSSNSSSVGNSQNSASATSTNTNSNPASSPDVSGQNTPSKVTGQASVRFATKK